MDLITRHESQRRRMRLAKIMFVTSILGILLAGGLSAYLLFFTGTPTSDVHVLAKQEPHTITSDPNIDAFKTIAQQYMKDGMQGNYGQDWSLLDPSLRALWPNQQAFTTFWQDHFQNYILKGFSMGKVTQLPTWVNPETMIQYTHVLQTGISLQIELKPGLQQAQLAPEVLHPAQLLQNIPLIAEQTTNTGKTWLVVEGGPFDLEAPVYHQCRQ